MSDATIRQDIAIGELGASRDVTNARKEVRAANTMMFEIFKTAADSMAGDATAETLGFSLPILPGYAAGDTLGIVTRIEVVTDADVASDAADGAVFTVSKRDSGGLNKTTLGTFSTLAAAGAGLAEFVAEAFTLTAANTVVVAGGSVTWEIAKAAGGKVVPISKIRVYVERV